MTRNPTLKLTATALGALAIGIAAPALAQDASATQPAPQTVTPAPIVAPIMSSPAPVVTPAETTAPAPQSTPPVAAAPAPKVLTLPEVEIPTKSSSATVSPVGREAAPRTTTPAAARRTSPAATSDESMVRDSVSPSLAPSSAATAPSSLPVAARGAESTTPVVASSAPPVGPANWELLAGIAGLGVIGAAGAGAMAMRRRRSPVGATEQPSVPDVNVGGAPERRVEARSAMASPLAPPARMPEPAAAAVASTFDEAVAPGFHERLAERGPTPDNPFVTRTARMRRARFYDRQARLAREQGMATPAHVEQPDQSPMPSRPEQVSYVFGKTPAGRNGLFPTFERTRS